jgi:hypothetical protein
MNVKVPLTIALSLTLVQLATTARAEERHEERAEHHEARQEVRHDQHLPPRAAPPAWRAHPPGPHPQGPGFHPGYHPHAVRVLRPRAYRWGEHPWHRWDHPEFARPVYYWDWGVVRNVSCIAEDSYGDQYPVSLTTFPGFGLDNMTTVEDDALNRCYDESGGDPSCYLATCSHF